MVRQRNWAIFTLLSNAHSQVIPYHENDLNSFMRVVSSWLNHFLKISSLDTVTITIKFQLEFWRRHANHSSQEGLLEERKPQSQYGFKDNSGGWMNNVCSRLYHIGLCKDTIWYSHKNGIANGDKNASALWSDVWLLVFLGVFSFNIKLKLANL
jgi:hypothetical protein